MNWGMNNKSSQSFPASPEVTCTIGVTHEGSGVVTEWGFDSYNQTVIPSASPTVRLPLGADNYAKVIVRYE